MATPWLIAPKSGSPPNSGTASSRASTLTEPGVLCLMSRAFYFERLHDSV
jgi:hypothetical protein